MQNRISAFFDNPPPNPTCISVRVYVCFLCDLLHYEDDDDYEAHRGYASEVKMGEISIEERVAQILEGPRS
jgi:hypothetical protein